MLLSYSDPIMSYRLSRSSLTRGQKDTIYRDCVNCIGLVEQHIFHIFTISR